MDCFCGCGRSVAFGRRGASKKGGRVTADLRDLEVVVSPRLAVEHANHRLDVLRAQVDRLQQQGSRIRADLVAVVHGDADDLPRDYSAFRGEAGSLIQPLKDKRDEERRRG